MKKKINNAGFSMVEVLIAVMVVGMVLTAVAAMMVSSIKTTSQGRYLSLASSKAQEGLEVFRRERFILGWQEFEGALLPGKYCLNEIPADSVAFRALSGGECSDSFEGAGLPFVREVTIAQPDTSTMEVEVEVRWLDGSMEKSTNLSQVFKEY